MQNVWAEGLREELERHKSVLGDRLDRITANVRRGLENDSKERAKQLEDREVIDALGNETRDELHKVSSALLRMKSGTYGSCTDCGLPIAAARIAAYPHAGACIDCANREEKSRAGRFRY